MCVCAFRSVALCNVFCAGIFVSLSQNQAEAHYKGHKHARKLKAMEAQKNKQRCQGAAGLAGRDREREREKAAVTEALPALMDVSAMEGTSE